MMTTEAMQRADINDAELVAESLGGNRDAFRLIVERYQTLISSLAYCATGNVSRSEDLAQETFVSAWKQLAACRNNAFAHEKAANVPTKAVCAFQKHGYFNRLLTPAIAWRCARMAPWRLGATTTTANLATTRRLEFEALSRWPSTRHRPQRSLARGWWPWRRVSAIAWRCAQTEL